MGDWVLEPDEFELRTRAREGFSVLDGDGFAVALDTAITPELALEGVARDLIRQINGMRADAGLELTDRINVTYPSSDGDLTRGLRAARAVDRRGDARRRARARCRARDRPRLMRLLVLGGTTFLGKHAVEGALARGDTGHAVQPGTVAPGAIR